MKSINDIDREFHSQRQRMGDTAAANLRECRDERDALLQQAGIKDGPEDMLADDGDKWRDEDYYRLRVREMVFNVRDGWLRGQIMEAMNRYRSKEWDYWETISLFDVSFVAELKQKRCCPPRKIGIGVGALGGVVITSLAYWFGGALDALVVSVGIVLPLLMFLAVHHITALWQHDLTYGEAVKIVERQAAESKARAARGILWLFSLRETRNRMRGQRTS